METFRTHIPVVRSNWDISHHSPVLALGSCFAEKTGLKLYQSHIPVVVNPWGTLFHPLAMESILLEALKGNPPEINPCFQQDETFYSLRFPSFCHGITSSVLETQVQEVHSYIGDVFKDFQFLIITLGTAWVYKHRASGLIATSCHKIPAREFDKILLSPEQVVQSLGELIFQARALKPDIKVILTVSPVRHTRDTLPLNSVSKSVLLWACHQIRENYSGVEYFPAYEILMDDLRDYRFYAEDKIHPSEEAVRYIWKHFSDTYFSEETQELNEQIEALNLGLAHRPRISGLAWYKHLDRMEEQAGKISRTFGIHLDRELSRIQDLRNDKNY